MLNTFLNILFPETCPLCSNPSSDHKTAPICPECWQSIVPYEGPKCLKCGKPLVSEASTTCGECLKDEPAFASAACYGLYDGALKKAINLMKYHNVKRLSSPLSRVMLNMKTSQVDAVLPVPLYITRLKQRGFNQSALIARYMAEGLGSKLILDSLVKVRDTKAQVGLNSRERRKNMRNAFGIKNRELIKGKQILLIDDVATTGATIRECSKVLKKAGAGPVHVITLAHGALD